MFGTVRYFIKRYVFMLLTFSLYVSLKLFHKFFFIIFRYLGFLFLFLIFVPLDHITKDSLQERPDEERTLWRLMVNLIRGFCGLTGWKPSWCGLKKNGRG